MNPLQAFELNEISNNSLPQESRPQFEITDMNSLNWAFPENSCFKDTGKRNQGAGGNRKAAYR